MKNSSKQKNIDTQPISNRNYVDVFLDWRRGGSNPRPLACHANALPAELRPHGNNVIF